MSSRSKTQLYNSPEKVHEYLIVPMTLLRLTEPLLESDLVFLALIVDLLRNFRGRSSRRSVVLVALPLPTYNSPLCLASPRVFPSVYHTLNCPEAVAALASDF